MSDVVLDASAVLALLNEEPGAEKVEAALGQASMTTVNLAEVLGKLIESGMPGDDAWSAVDELNLRLVPFDIELARGAAALRPATRQIGLSLGDRACLALGLSLASPVLTTDRAWETLTLGVDVQLIR